MGGGGVCGVCGGGIGGVRRSGFARGFLRAVHLTLDDMGFSVPLSPSEAGARTQISDSVSTALNFMPTVRVTLFCLPPLTDSSPPHGKIRGHSRSPKGHPSTSMRDKFTQGDDIGPAEDEWCVAKL